MFPQINIKETGINLRLIMDKRGITPRKVKEYLKLGSVQSVYDVYLYYETGDVLHRYNYKTNLSIQDNILPQLHIHTSFVVYKC